MTMTTEYERIVRFINRMYEGPIEGFDWDKDTIHEKIDYYCDKLKPDLPDNVYEDFWVGYEEPRLITKLNKRLVLYRIRAYNEELRELEDAELRRMYPSLEDEGYFKFYETDFKWYFDPAYCQCARLQDYQRLMLRDYREYEDWEYYREICSTLEGDQQFVQFWEEVAYKTKWIIHCLEARRRVWCRLERVVYYHAMKIATGFPEISRSLVSSGYSEYISSVKFDQYWLKSYVDFYHSIWRRVAKEKMDFKEAFRQLYEESIHDSLWRSELKAELDMLDRDEIRNPGPVQTNYAAYVAKIDGGVTEGTSRQLISGAIDKIILRPKVYNDYAKEKLDIAKEIGLIKPS